MLHIGCHLSVSQGFLHMGDEALSIGADTFQFFSRNPRGSRVRKLDIDDMEALNKLMAEHDFAPILAHAPYTLNGCSQTEKTREFARQAMADDLRRLEYLDNCRYISIPAAMSDKDRKRASISLPTCQYLHVSGAEDDGSLRNHGRQGDGSRADL